MFASLARMVTGHPWRVIAIWVVASVAIVVFSPSISSVTNANSASFLPSHYQSVQAQAALARDFPKQSGNTDLLVVQRADGAPLTAADQQEVTKFAADLTHAGIKGVTGTFTSSDLLSPNGKAQLVNVTLQGQPGEPAVNNTVKAIRAAVPRELTGTGLTAGLTGASAIALDTSSAFAKAENIIAIATILLIVILLGLIFRRRADRRPSRRAHRAHPPGGQLLGGRTGSWSGLRCGHPARSLAHRGLVRHRNRLLRLPCLSVPESDQRRRTDGGTAARHRGGGRGHLLVSAHRDRRLRCVAPLVTRPAANTGPRV